MKKSPEIVIVISRCSWTLHNFRLALIQTIQKTGARVLAVGSDDGIWGHRLNEASVEFQSAPISHRGTAPLSDLFLLYELFRLFRRERPTVVHAFTIKPAIYGSIAAWMANVPVRVVTITGLGHIFLSANSLLRHLVEGLYRFALRHVHVVIFQNEDDRRLFLQRGLVLPEKTRLVAGSGVDLIRFAPAPLPIERGEEPTILMVARLLKEKGVVEYIEAARLVRTVNSDVRFRLVGGVDPRNPSGITEAQFKALNADNVVEWIGEVDDVAPHLREADIVALPSYREGIPRSLLEAAAMARPLVTTDAPGCREVVQDGINGRLIPVKNAPALANAIISMIQDRDSLIKMGLSSRSIVENQYDEKNVIEYTLQIYSDILKG